VVEVLDKVGCAAPIATEGVPWHVAHTYVGGREIDTTIFPRPSGFEPFINISQFRIEQILLERVAGSPLAGVAWNHRVSSVSQDGEGVEVEAATPDGPRRLRFRHLVACDGVRSALRDLVGVEWTGYSHGDLFLITDLRARLPFARERHFHYDPPFNPGRQVIMHPQPRDMWRIDWQLLPDVDIDAERRTGDLDQRIRTVIGAVDYEIDWLSTYRFHQRVVDRFRVGNVFFAGDAAHALPPYGARGMNSGIQDADNLAWKLALVVRGQAADSLLDTYHTERYAAALENLRVTEGTIRFMVPPTPLRRLGRNLLLALAPSVKPLRRRVNSGRMAEPFVYADSPIVDPGGSPLAGHLAPDGAVASDGGPRRLREALGAGFLGMYVGADPGEASRFVAQVLAAGEPVPVHPVVVLPPGVEGHRVPAGATLLRDAEGTLGAAYNPAGEAMWYLVRPDGHIAAARPGHAAGDLGGVLASCIGGRAIAGLAGSRRPEAVNHAGA
jgi:2-polyprenyl-6-methoxyphenol hydroxylase-like FAD-dependent oxidoreductase